MTPEHADMAFLILAPIILVVMGFLVWRRAR